MINTVTLNPAIDHILYLPRFRRNITNRIRSTQTTMGGKGTHVSLNLRLMGSPSRAFGFAFGKTGQRIIDMLREGGVEPYFIYDARGESRTNYLLVEEETKDATLVADRGPMPDGKQTEAFYRLLSETVQDWDCLALSGDTSNFPDPWIYNHILERLSNKEIRVFLDASGKSLHRGMEASPFLAKPNRDELAALVGETLTGDADVLRAIRKVDKYNIRVLEVTNDCVVFLKAGHYAETQGLFDELAEKIGVLQFIRSGRIAITKSRVERLSDMLAEREEKRKQALTNN